MSSTLSAHSPKFNSQLVTLADVKALPEPQALGRLHKPVAHGVLVEALQSAVQAAGYVVSRTQLAVSKNLQALFGVFDFGCDKHPDRTLSMGFRNAVDQSLAIKVVAGTRVFVCDNLALSGDQIALQRRNTIRLDLEYAINVGLEKFKQSANILDAQIAALQAVELTDDAAKTAIFDVFAKGVIPVRLFNDVRRAYFEPADDATDVQPRTLWGLHNAFTRVARDLSPRGEFLGSVNLGAHFAGLLGQPIIDAEVEAVE